MEEALAVLMLVAGEESMIERARICHSEEADARETGGDGRGCELSLDVSSSQPRTPSLRGLSHSRWPCATHPLQTRAVKKLGK